MNEAEQAQAIYCNCYSDKVGRYKILGSITAEGYFEVLRARGSRTLIQAGNLHVYCPECQYSRFLALKSSDKPASYI